MIKPMPNNTSIGAIVNRLSLAHGRMQLNVHVGLVDSNLAVLGLAGKRFNFCGTAQHMFDLLPKSGIDFAIDPMIGLGPFIHTIMYSFTLGCNSVWRVV